MLNKTRHQLHKYISGTTPPVRIEIIKFINFTGNYENSQNPGRIEIFSKNKKIRNKFYFINGFYKSKLFWQNQIKNI